MKKSCIIALFLVSNFCFSQEQVNLKESFLEAEYYILYEDFKEALPLYLKVVNNGLDNAYINYRVGECYLQIPGQKSKSIPYLEKAIKDISSDFKEGSFKETHAPKNSIFLLGNAYQINNNLDEAILMYEKFKESLEVNDVYNIDYVDQQIQACKNAKELMKSPTRIKETNLGNIINDEFSNIRPVISSNEQEILFTSKLKFYDAVFYSEKVGGNWDVPTNLTPAIKSDGDFYTSSISNNGKTLVLFRNDKFSGDIYLSHFENNGWQVPEKLNKNINSKGWETHGTLSSDGKTFYFVSDRKDGFGGLDIYKSVYDETINDWGVAVNLGPEINTAYNEETPIITEDGNMLFFSSQGHYNMGGFDIFYSKKLNENEWSSPVNIGYPINTTDDDLAFYPVKNGTFAYVSKFSKDGFGLDDIVRYEIFSPEHPFEINVKGTVTLLDNQVEFPKNNFSVDVIDSLKSKTLYSLELNENSGTFNTKLKPGIYKFIFNSKEYKQKSKILFIPEDYPRDELTMNIELTPLSVSTGEYITVKSIFFDFDNSSLSRDAKIELERVYNLMVQYPSLYIEVIGHTDAIGASQYNYNLSVKRARSAIDYLTKKGIDPKRFVAKGAGKSQPIAINKNNDGTDNAEGRKFNRRVEIKILKSEERLIIDNDVNLPENLKDRNLTYSILLLKQENRLPADYFDKYEELYNYNINEYQDGLYIYTLGVFKQKSKLIEIYNTILELGFSNAEIISSYDLQILLNENEAGTDISETDFSVTYTIQLKATSVPVNTETFKPLEGVKEIKCIDGYYRYIYGEFKNKDFAVKELDKLINKGFNEALVIELNKYK
ncbi:MAG: hypothetical protein A2X13_10700 [Bacteroidetes bacterium GWC2_33_15]|nr:MAG: hypothetical protein A2X10_03250 [Bacteroidetes bacterium GWA2_33_15]OFX48865.1 MAG: hypothetical protein A2X13_10700 [Bacteroidetes bacterium GWC2_33_15]OFX66108.1 MAG: hypothetical protein A2X15_11845 [Bacteroidetes bacterium GWB2_32_14]OFX68130.1 MAG: hypothetical protein A2X14_07050 [Bacteroidetes bacterium GWD2_33_33]HAN17900.1 hypothetical protein [Bacteroidales bacterium]